MIREMIYAVLIVSLINLTCLGGEADRLIAAREHFLSGEIEKAEEKCRDFIEEYPESFFGYMLLGAICSEYPGREREAVSYYEYALTVEDQYPSIYGEISLLYTRINMYDEAIEALDRGLASFPGDPGLNYGIGQLYLMEKKDPDSAIKHFSKALELRPDDRGLLYITGFANIAAGNRAEALGYITSLREIREESLAIQLEDVLRQMESGRGVDVGEAVQKYVEEAPGREDPGKEGLDKGARVDDVDPSTRVTGSGTLTVKTTLTSQKEQIQEHGKKETEDNAGIPSTRVRGSGTLTTETIYSPRNR